MCIRTSHVLPLFTLFLAFSAPARADSKSFPAQGRLFIGNTMIHPDELNNEMTAQGLNTFNGLTGFGVEITYPALRFLDLGMRYTRHLAMEYESAGNSTLYYGAIGQNAILLLARVPFLRTSVFKFDVFGGVGGTNTSFELKTASVDGKLTKTGPAEWFAAPIWSYGASAGVGYKQFCFFVEGGFERNVVRKLESFGTMTGNVGTLDLSGRYVMLGLLFDGITASSR
ncbi:MAG: hypothetical protein NDJ89_16115 [Oligoflexia bacterium]|nr:hypothetical protein [Oligoflexia bacterium]